jgi:hypothetical protein
MPPETRTCPVCWTEFTTSPRGRRRVYCSKKCCGAAWERRGGRQTQPATPKPAPSPATTPQPAATCNCPHCGEPVTIVALLTTPQAARPRLPAHAPQALAHRPS